MELIRGDTGIYKFQRKDATGEIIYQTPVAMYFTIKKSYKAPRFVLQKTLNDMTVDSDGFWHFTIEADDTQALAVGSYVYDLEVTENDYVATISKGTFELLDEATWYINK